jgi:hypothetical protein
VDVHDHRSILRIGLIEKGGDLKPIEGRVPDNLRAPEGAPRYTGRRGAGETARLPVGQVY